MVYAATKGYLDKMSVSNILSFEAALLKEIDPEILSEISKEKSISDNLNQKLKTFFDGFTSKFLRA